MAITYNSASSGNGTSTTLTFAHTVNAGDDRIIIVGTGVEAINASDYRAVSTITYDGDALTKIAHQDFPDRDRAELWYRLAPTVTTGNVVVTLTSNNIAGVAAGAITINGAKQQAPEASASGTGTGTTSSITITTATNNAWVVEVAANSSSSTDQVPASSQDERYEDANNLRLNGSTIEVATAAETTLNWTIAASKAWGNIGASFEQAAAAEGAPGAMSTNTGYWGPTI